LLRWWQSDWQPPVPTPIPSEGMPGVLLDANVYRSLPEARFAPLLEAELHKGVARFCDPFVTAELLAHAADPADPQHRPCRVAIRRAQRRCRSDAGGTCGMLQDSESRLVLLVTGRPIARHDEYTQLRILPLMEAVATIPLDQPLTVAEPELREVARNIAERKEEFAQSAVRLQETIAEIVKDEEPETRRETLKNSRRTHGSEANRRLTAERMIRGAFENSGLRPPDPIPEELFKRVWSRIATAVEFECQIWDKVAFDGALATSRAIRTLRWDQRIAHYIGDVVHGHPLWFITEDADFARAAAAAGMGERVKSLDAYEGWLQ